MNTVFCPVLNAQIDGTTCLEIVLVADGEMNKRILPDGLEWNEEQCQKCLNCKWHADLTWESDGRHDSRI